MLTTFHQTTTLEAGLDEAGRGCYAGPVYAAAVILPEGFFHPLLNDSKQVAEEDRNILRIEIEKHAVAFAVAAVDNTIIDKINILQASFRAMHLAVKKLSTKPGLLLVDGNRFKTFRKIPHKCFIKGDGIYASIAAASILAKTHRDEYMTKLHKSYPHYCWDSNKGYGTAAHRKAILEHGLCDHHRKSFAIDPTQFMTEDLATATI